MSLEMLPARHGDGLWLEWGEPDDRHLMIIDGGTRAASAHLRDRLEERGADPRVDLLVVTHIDLDHIEAPIELLRTSALNVQFDDIWFNDYRHLDDTTGAEETRGAGTTRGGVQGEFLGSLIERYDLPWNRAFDGGPIVIPNSGPLPTIELAGGMRLVLLSPTREKLQDLRPVWDDEVRKKDLSPGDRARAMELLELRMGPAQVTRGKKEFGKDGSEANGSSIAFIAEYNDQRWLLSGDAHAGVLASSLKRYAKQIREDLPIRLDGFKIPHHGSVNNMSSGLLDLIDCRRFLVSSNGAYFKHPDQECIDLIIEKSGSSELAFNYRTKFTERWADRPGVTYEYGADHRRLDVPGSAAAAPERALDAPVSTATSAPAVTASGEPAPAAELKVRVFHGGLDRAGSTVIVGHYNATPLSGAEAYVNRSFDSRLSDRHTRGQYPGAIGSRPLYVRAPVRCHPGGGVLVIGLGDYGELTPLTLAETIRSSLVAHALDVADADPDQPTSLSISSVLVGATGDQGIGVRSAARAIVEGVVLANESLTDNAQTTRCQYNRLDIWERNAPEAELALIALGSGSDAEDAPRSSDKDMTPVCVTVDQTLYRRDGHLMHSVPESLDQRPWRRIVVKHEQDEDSDRLLKLVFTIDRRLAVVGEDYHVVERRQLTQLLEDAVNSPALSEGLYAALFELLLPNEIKSDLMSAADIQLVVDAETAEIPWEMLAARNPRAGTREALAVRAPMTRQLADSTIRAIDRSDELRAMVIGNPPAGPNWPQLPGAYAEALAVIETLERSGLAPEEVCNKIFKPSDRSGPGNAAELVPAMFENDYRIIHVAGHGAYDPDDETRTGVVIGPDEFLTARFLTQLPRVPDLVFLNCCHLGRMDGHLGPNAAAGSFPQLGASVSRQLIRSGVRAVVAAGWAVDDDAATAFATTFYEQMLRMGSSFGEAVFVARKAALTAAPNASTWGAYQCYGDSGLRMQRLQTTSLAPEPRTVRDALRRIEYVRDKIESRGAMSLDATLESVEEELKILTNTARKRDWLTKEDGGVLAEQFGRVHADLGQYQLAIDWYQTAVEHPSGGASLNAVEQLANLRDRFAASLVRSSNPNPNQQQAASLAQQAEASIASLTELGGTSERAALLAGHHKRQATVYTGPKRFGELRKAADKYLAAYEIEENKLAEKAKQQTTGESVTKSDKRTNTKRTAKQSKPDPYALLNYIQLEELRGRLDKRRPSRVTEQQALESRRIARAEIPATDEDYWDAVSRADAELTRLLRNGLLHRTSSTSRLAKLYLDAFTRRSTARERSSSVEHLVDLAELHPDEAERDGLHKLIAALRASDHSHE